MAVLINEWLPNPTGNDAAGEFVELFNNGAEATRIDGWTLRTLGKKQAKIQGAIPARGFLLLPRTSTKLVLRNTDEGVALYNATGVLVDESKFIGAAPEGKSFNRATIAGASSTRNDTQQFRWMDPTPGAVNHASAPSEITVFSGPFDVPLNHAALGAGGFISVMLGIAALLTGLILYSIKANEDLSNLFFARDETAGPTSGL